MSDRNYKKVIQGGRFKWFINPTDMKDIAGTAEACLGLTRGANINFGDAELRSIEVDGQLGMVKGGVRITDVQPSIQLSLLQSDEGVISSLKRFLIDVSEAGKTEYRPKGILEDIDYIDKLVGVGETQDHSVVIIVLENAILNTLPSFDLSDKDEAVLPVTFMGTYESADSKKVPITLSLLGSVTNSATAQVADTALKGESFDIAVADVKDEASVLAALDTAIQAAIVARVGDTSAYPDAKYVVTLRDGEDNISSIVGSADGDSADIKYNLSVTGFDTDQAGQTSGTLTVDTIA